MERRSFLKNAAIGVTAGAVAAPAIATSTPTVRWRLASSFPKSVDAIYGTAEFLASRVAGITDGKFQIRPFAGGEIVPGLQVLDAVQQGTVECGHTAGYYYHGKNKALSIDTTLPFGMTTRQQNAWMYQGGGIELLRELYKQYGVMQWPGGNTGTQMGGWFRKPIRTLKDVQGLKIRIPGFGGEIFSRLGAVPQAIAGADIYPALEKGTIDAAEWVGPYDDEKLGLQRVARYYYYPGFWEGNAQLSFLVNIKEWEKLPRAYQEAFEAACAEAHLHMTARYDAKNPLALSNMVRNGAKLKQYPREIMTAAYVAAQAIYAEEAAKNPAFKKIYTEWERFRNEQLQWFRTAEASFSNFVYYQAPIEKPRK